MRIAKRWAGLAVAGVLASVVGLIPTVGHAQQPVVWKAVPASGDVVRAVDPTQAACKTDSKAASFRAKGGVENPCDVRLYVNQPVTDDWTFSVRQFTGTVVSYQENCPDYETNPDACLFPDDPHGTHAVHTDTYQDVSGSYRAYNAQGLDSSQWTSTDGTRRVGCVSRNGADSTTGALTAVQQSSYCLALLPGVNTLIFTPAAALAPGIYQIDAISNAKYLASPSTCDFGSAFGCYQSRFSVAAAPAPTLDADASTDHRDAVLTGSAEPFAMVKIYPSSDAGCTLVDDGLAKDDNGVDNVYGFHAYHVSDNPIGTTIADPTGQFSVPAALQRGANDLVVIATSAANTTSEVVSAVAPAAPTKPDATDATKYPAGKDDPKFITDRDAYNAALSAATYKTGCQHDGDAAKPYLYDGTVTQSGVSSTNVTITAATDDQAPVVSFDAEPNSGPMGALPGKIQDPTGNVGGDTSGCADVSGKAQDNDQINSIDVTVADFATGNTIVLVEGKDFSVTRDHLGTPYTSWAVDVFMPGDWKITVSATDDHPNTGAPSTFIHLVQDAGDDGVTMGADATDSGDLGCVIGGEIING